MKLATYRIDGWPEDLSRVGCIEGELLIDVTMACGVHLGEIQRDPFAAETAGRIAPSDLVAILRRWDSARPVIERSVRHVARRAAAGGGPNGLAYSLTEVVLLPPVRPGKIVHTGSNFLDHQRELETTSAVEWKAHNWSEFQREVPTGFLISPDSLVGNEGVIIKPRRTRQLDHEIEIAAIIGKRVKNVSIAEALEYVAGYTIFNDISARDIQALEHNNRMILLGKSMDTFSPMGPWMVTIDEIPDPQALDMELTVNGDVRQHASTGQMYRSLAELISYWSQATLMPGDVMTSGTPSGVAAFRKPDPIPFFLNAGDMIEARIAGLGLLRNVVQDEPLGT